MPRYQTEGQKTVKRGDVAWVLEVINAPRNQMHVKLREGLDAMALVARDDGDKCLKGVYPWPTMSYKSTPAFKAAQSNALATTNVKSQIMSRSVKKSFDETEEAVASIEEIPADNHPDVDNGDAYVESVTGTGIPCQGAQIRSEVEAVADEDIDPDAFQVRQDRAS